MEVLLIAIDFKNKNYIVKIYYINENGDLKNEEILTNAEDLNFCIYAFCKEYIKNFKIKNLNTDLNRWDFLEENKFFITKREAKDGKMLECFIKWSE